MRLSRWQECGYAAAEGGLSATETFVRLHFLFYLTQELGMSPARAGLLVSMGVFWDGLIDPFAGWISDRTKTPWGRRIPYILAGLVLLPLLLWLLFLPEFRSMHGLPQTLAVGGIYLLLNTAMTLIGVPHAALAGDLSSDESSRTRLFAWRYFYTTIGLLMGIAVPGYFLAHLGPGIAAYAESSVVLAIFIAVSSLLTVVACFNGDRRAMLKPNLAQHNPFVLLRSVIGNKPFLILIGAFILATIGQAINSSLAVYYYRLKLQLDEAMLQTVLVLFTFVIIGSIVAWNLLSRRFEKYKLLAIGVGLLGLTGSLAYPLFPSGQVQGPLAMAVIGGILVGSVFLLEVMVTDTVDFGALKSGSNDYGSYFGLWKLGSKISRAIAIGLSGFLLQFIGFEAQSAPSELTLHKLGLLFGPGVGLFFMAGAGLILFYPLRDKKVRQVQNILRRRGTKSEAR